MGFIYVFILLEWNFNVKVFTLCYMFIFLGYFIFVKSYYRGNFIIGLEKYFGYKFFF